MATPSDETEIPGTVQLVDLAGTVLTKHSRDHSDIVLVPTPSNDPDDPLNWSKSRKLLSTISLAVFVWCSGLCGFTANSSLSQVAKGLGLPLATLNSGAGYLFLLAGWSNLFWQPVALQYGKRPVYIISTIGNLALTAWTPSIRSTGQLWANKIVLGFFCAPIESLCEVSISDVYFAHERSTYMAAYALSLTGSNFFAPVIGGFITDNLGWQWCYYIPSIISAVGTVFLLLFMEETNYDRQPVSQAEETTVNEKIVVPVVDPCHTLPRKTYFQKLSLWSVPQKSTMFWWRFKEPLHFLTWPIVLWAGFSYGQNLVWFNVLNATASLILSNPPYNFSAAMVGLAFIAAFLGAVVAALYTGPACDWLGIRISRRKGGIFEPEYRLWMFVLNVALVPASLILWGVGAAHEIHWFGLMVAMFLIAVTAVTGCTLSLNYVVDSYQALASDAIVSMILVRNTMSFAIGYAITPWVENMGYQNCFITAGMIGLAGACSFFVMIKFGKRLRANSAQKYWQKVLKRSQLGVAH